MYFCIYNKSGTSAVLVLTILFFSKSKMSQRSFAPLLYYNWFCYGSDRLTHMWPKREVHRQLPQRHGRLCTALYPGLNYSLLDLRSDLTSVVVTFPGRAADLTAATTRPSQLFCVGDQDGLQASPRWDGPCATGTSSGHALCFDGEGVIGDYREAVVPSMALMRRLLIDAQVC